MARRGGRGSETSPPEPWWGLQTPETPLDQLLTAIAIVSYQLVAIRLDVIMPVVFLRNDTFHIVYLDYVIFIGYNVAYQIGIMSVDGDQDI